jgi:O-phosphoseryl-tRNA synthetase
LGTLKPDEILKRVKSEGFEKVWSESATLLPKPKKRLELFGKGGASHPLFEILYKFRQNFIDLGFTEVSNRIIVDEAEVYKQYGSEAAVILDRCYYLATLPRPDIGLSNEKCNEIEKLGVLLNKEKIKRLKRVLRRYKIGEIEAEDFVEETSDALDVSNSKSTRILSKVFPELSTLKPEPSTLTLRSHMTSSWFSTLQALQHKLELPIKLFSVGIRFRREQREDPTHLRAHHSASCVVMDEEVGVEDGEEITKALLKVLGFEGFRFVRKRATSNYYAPGTEYEGYIFHSGMGDWIEVANYGLYSPIALARYNLEYPVLNVGIGVERVALASYGANDVRRLVHPQFYAEWTLTDFEIASMVEIDEKPESEVGAKIYELIKSTALDNAEEVGPCEFQAYEGEIFGRKIRVCIYETDAGAKLLGPAAFNIIVVHNGNILCIPEKGMELVPRVLEARKRGISVGFSCLDAVAALAAAKIEDSTKLGSKEVNVRVKMVKRPSDVNIKISNVARRYITDMKKKIEVTGPVFVGIRAKIMSDLGL